MRDHIFNFTDASTEQKFLEMAETSHVRTQWIAIDPNPQCNGEYQFASEEIWDDLPDSLREMIDDETPDEREAPPWPKTPFEQWNQDDRRRLIFLAVQEFDCVGDRLPEKTKVLKAFREGRLPNP